MMKSRIVKQKYKPKSYWTDENFRLEVAPFKRRMDFKNGNLRAYNIARKRGPEFMDWLCSDMEPSLTEAYSDEELTDAAKPHKTRGAFYENDEKAYQAASKRGKEFLDRICSHMSSILHSTYTDEELESIALGFKKEVDFKNERSGAYSAAYSRGLHFLKRICSHMKRGDSKPELLMLAEVQKYFPNAKKFRATKLKISGKEYIKTLEVDILIKELSKAIEYDGRYHHSIEGLTRGHPTWPPEHIKIYHDIKDEAFLNLGIEILHIKQDDWKNKRSECITIIEEFLGITGFMSEPEQRAA